MGHYKHSAPLVMCIYQNTTDSIDENGDIQYIAGIKFPRRVTGVSASMATAVPVASRVTVTLIRPLRLIKRPSAETPLKVRGETYACTSRVRPPKVTMVRVFIPILKSGNNVYPGVYYSTGVIDKMYQPRKTPLNWVPVKWNGQDI